MPNQKEIMEIVAGLILVAFISCIPFIGAIFFIIVTYQVSKIYYNRAGQPDFLKGRAHAYIICFLLGLIANIIITYNMVN